MPYLKKEAKKRMSLGEKGTAKMPDVDKGEEKRFVFNQIGGQRGKFCVDMILTLRDNGERKGLCIKWDKGYSDRYNALRQ